MITSALFQSTDITSTSAGEHESDSREVEDTDDDVQSLAGDCTGKSSPAARRAVRRRRSFAACPEATTRRQGREFVSRSRGRLSGITCKSRISAAIKVK